MLTLKIKFDLNNLANQLKADLENNKILTKEIKEAKAVLEILEKISFGDFSPLELHNFYKEKLEKYIHIMYNVECSIDTLYEALNMGISR